MPKVFFIDENYSKIESLKFIFEVNGFECFSSRHSAEALFILSRLKPDVIVMDMHFSDTDGREVAKKIRAYEHLTDTIIIGYSAMAGSLMQNHRDLHTIITELLPHPINANNLVKLIKKYLNITKE